MFLMFDHEVKALPDPTALLDARERSISVLLDLGSACNMRCEGCPGRGDATSLSSDAVRSLGEVVMARVRREHATRLYVVLYGGEPLLDAENVIGLSACLQAECRSAAVDYAGHLITNGTLLAWVDARRLAAAGIVRLQVTLDGGSREHDARRRLLDGTGSWERIVEGLEAVRGAVSLLIRATAEGLTPAVEDLLVELDRASLLGEGAAVLLVAPSTPYVEQARDLLRISSFLDGRPAHGELAVACAP
jgi:uncharacterized protein